MRELLVLEEGAVLAGKYRLTRPAGFGGMAQLWVATNRATGAEVCIKILIPERIDDESVERFRREAYAAARLSHRAIVRIFDLVELAANGETTASGKPAALAIVMELLHGETLADVLMKRDKLSVDEMIDLALPFLSALAHAHRAGVVHRDLKPDNIFLSTDPDGHIIPKVLDFGVSKMAAGGERPGANNPLTLDGEMLGTPSYMSPEQARGSRQVDARSDVFSAGILMYMMISGRNPFERDSFHAVVSAIIHEAVPPLNGVPDEIWDVIARSLSKDPEARYRDATELGIALRRASGRTSTTDSGPQSGVGRTSSPRLIVAPLGGDSIVTVPPAGDADAPVEAPASAVARRRAMRIVVGVLAMAAVLVVAAFLRNPAGAEGVAALPSPPSGPSPQAIVTAALSEVPPPLAPPTATAIASAPAPVDALADAGAAKKPSGGAPRAAPLAAPGPKKEAHPGADTEPSIVRDPGF